MTKRKPKKSILTLTIEEEHSVTTDLKFKNIKDTELAPVCALIGVYLQHIVQLIVDGNKAEMKRLEKHIETIKKAFTPNDQDLSHLQKDI